MPNYSSYSRFITISRLDLAKAVAVFNPCEHKGLNLKAQLTIDLLVIIC